MYMYVCIYIYMNMYVRIRNDGGVFFFLFSFARRAPSIYPLLTPRLTSIRLYFHASFFPPFFLFLSFHLSTPPPSRISL